MTARRAAPKGALEGAPPKGAPKIPIRNPKSAAGEAFLQAGQYEPQNGLSQGVNTSYLQRHQHRFNSILLTVLNTRFANFLLPTIYHRLPTGLGRDTVLHTIDLRRVTRNESVGVPAETRHGVNRLWGARIQGKDSNRSAPAVPYMGYLHQEGPENSGSTPEFILQGRRIGEAAYAFES